MQCSFHQQTLSVCVCVCVCVCVSATDRSSSPHTDLLEKLYTDSADDGVLDSDRVHDALRLGPSPLESRRIQAEPRRHSSPGQEQPKRVVPAAAAAGGPGAQRQEPRLRGGPGVQPRGAARHRAPLSEERLVQDAAAQTDHPRGGLHQPDHHQPLLLRPVQLLLHPQTRAARGGSLPVLLLLQAQALHHHDLHPQLPRPAAAHPQEARAAGQAVPLHLHRAGLEPGAVSITLYSLRNTLLQRSRNRKCVWHNI